MDNRFLIITQAGDRSHHPKWLEDGQPNFDLFISYCGDQPNKYQDQCAFYDQQRGGRWQVLSQLIEEYWELISTYDAIWLANDTLQSTAENINKMFALFNGHQLALAQPALSLNSHYQNSVFLQQKNMQLRFTNGIEAIAPIMSSHSLAQLHQTLNTSTTDHNLSAQWSALLDNPKHDQIAIIDATPMNCNTGTGQDNKEKRPIKIYWALKISNSQSTLFAALRGYWHTLTLATYAKFARAIKNKEP